MHHLSIISRGESGIDMAAVDSSILGLSNAPKDSRQGQEIHEDAQVERLQVLNKLELLSKPGERARATGTSLPFLTEASTSPFDRVFTHNWLRRSRGAPPPSPTAGTRIVDHTDYQRRCP